MDKAGKAWHCKLGDQTTGDISICLRNSEGRPDCFYSHSYILKDKSKFFADQLSQPGSSTCIEVHCSGYDYDHHVSLLRLLYLPTESVLDSLDSVNTAIGVLQLAVAFHCEGITQSCIQYLEAVPWEDKEEEDILRAVSKLGPIAMPILARIQPVDLKATKNVFISAIRFATSIVGPCPPFGDDLKTSAQEQIEYMIGEDEETPLITADDEVKHELRKGLSNIFSSFEKELSSLLLESDLTSETVENRILRSLSDLEWMCGIVSKMELMKDFVSNWSEISGNALKVVEDKKLDSHMWGFKLKLIEITGKVLEAVSYGNVVIAAPCRLQLLNMWLPYIRKMKSLLELKCNNENNFRHTMNDDLCQSIEGAIVLIVLALPSNDQADILADWMNTEQVKYPDLSEVFEVWCYRTKSAKRRLEEGLDRVGNAAVSL